MCRPTRGRALPPRLTVDGRVDGDARVVLDAPYREARLVAPVGHDVPAINRESLAVPRPGARYRRQARRFAFRRSAAVPGVPRGGASAKAVVAIVQKHGLHESGLGRWLHRIDDLTLPVGRSHPVSRRLCGPLRCRRRLPKDFPGAGHAHSRNVPGGLCARRLLPRLTRRVPLLPSLGDRQARLRPNDERTGMTDISTLGAHLQTSSALSGPRSSPAARLSGTTPTGSAAPRRRSSKRSGARSVFDVDPEAARLSLIPFVARPPGDRRTATSVGWVLMARTWRSARPARTSASRPCPSCSRVASTP